MAGIRVEDLREESREDLELLKFGFRTVIDKHLRRLTLDQNTRMLLGMMLSCPRLLLVLFLLFLVLFLLGSLPLPRFLGRRRCRLRWLLRRS
jgi:hypothetical protein